MIDIHAWGTTNGLRATLALAECELPHRVVPVDLSRQQQKLPDYLALNPAGQIPTMVDPEAPGGRLVLAQSGAIVLYACRKAGRHVPADPATHALALQWFMQAATDIGGASAGLAQVAVVSPEKVPSHIALFEQRLLRYFRLADAQLADRDHLAGEFSFADIMMYPNYALRRALLERLADLPHLRRWSERMAQRPANRAGMRLMEAG